MPYNKMCHCTQSDFIGFWEDSLVVMNGTSGEAVNSVV
jgi:hypothetical protein